MKQGWKTELISGCIAQILMLFLLLSISLINNSQAQESSTVTDIEGNVYKTRVIGNYQWMSGNLRTTLYNDGEKIPNLTANKDWVESHTGAFCWYNNDAVNAITYGALYNWYAVDHDRLCPEGWHVPSDEDWKRLEGYADSKYGPEDPVWDNLRGRGNDAGRKLMADSGWNSGGNGSDDLGFSALPGGERLKDGGFFAGGRSGFWWSSSSSNDSIAWYRNMIYGMEDVYRDKHPKRMGFSVRCMKDR